MTLGQKIKTARQAKGLTQKQLVGDYITRNMLSKIENDAATPSVRTLEYLARALEVPTSFFLGDAPLSDGTAPDGLNEARDAYRQGRWLDCLAALDVEPTAASTDEGYLLQALAGSKAAVEAMDRGDWTAARELAESAQYYNQEGMYRDPYLAARLSLILGRCLVRLGEEGLEEQRVALRKAADELGGETL